VLFSCLPQKEVECFYGRSKQYENVGRHGGAVWLGCVSIRVSLLRTTRLGEVEAPVRRKHETGAAFETRVTELCMLEGVWA
jgi:hypothetical protein